MVTSKDMRWAWCGAHETEMRNVCRVLIRICEELRPHQSSEEGWEFNNKVDVD
jgi:hypothetical protein